MGATLARREEKQAKRSAYEPFIDELKQLAEQGHAAGFYTLDGPVEAWHSLEVIQERLRRARLCKELEPRRDAISQKLGRLHLAGFADYHYYDKEQQNSYWSDPEGYMAFREVELKRAKALEKAWPARQQIVQSLPFKTLCDLGAFKRLTDAEFQLDIENRNKAHSHQVHLNMAKALVEQGFLPPLDMCLPFMGYENVSDLEDMVQKRMIVRERYLESICSKFVEPEPLEEGSLL